MLADYLELPGHLVGEAMGNDICMTWVNNNYAMEGIVHEREGDGHIDEWGIEWQKQGAFNQIKNSPFANTPIADIEDFVFPYARIDDLLALMNPVIVKKHAYFIGCDVSPCVFEMYNRLRGMEQAILDLAMHPREVYELLGTCADFAIKLSQVAVERLPLDLLWTGDDVAGQQSMLMSPDTWRSLIKPHLARVVEVGKRAGLCIAYHCCGAMSAIIEDLIEIGIDILNPIQYGCPGMDARELKEQYGTRITFMGGVDTQLLLPYGTPDDVKRVTESIIENMTTDGGGYILAASHTVPPETSLENIFAMYASTGLAKEAILDTAATLRKRES